MSEQQPIYNLFPISEEVASYALSVLYSDNRWDYTRDINRLWEGANSHLFGVLARRKRDLQEFGQGKVDASNLIEPDRPLFSYLCGMSISNDILLREANLRGGILPIVPKNLVYTWLKDDTRHIVEDINAFVGFMGTGEDMEESFRNLARVERMNRFGSGIVQTILRGEPALLAAINDFLPEDINGFSGYKIRVQPFTRGLTDVVSIFKALHETETLRSIF